MEITRQYLSDYEQQLAVLTALRNPVKRALQIMAFNIRSGTTDEQALYSAIFSNTTKFGLDEAVLLAYHFSWGVNDLRVLGAAATDTQIQTCVDAIKAELISLENSRATIVGLN